MTEVWIKFKGDRAKRIDSAESETEAINLLEEYRKQYGNKIKNIWVQNGPVNQVG